MTQLFSSFLKRKVCSTYINLPEGGAGKMISPIFVPRQIWNSLFENSSLTRLASKTLPSELIASRLVLFRFQGVSGDLSIINRKHS